MPLRSFSRQQAWLLPPTLEELIPPDHPARFIAEFVDSLDPETWIELEVNLEGEVLGSPAYHPRALLSVWLYGFMTGVRSSRKLEAACRDQVSYLWLTGWQHPTQYLMEILSSSSAGHAEAAQIYCSHSGGDQTD